MKKSDRMIRDYLAAERTDLAIDRTLFSYIRTSMTVVIVGISLIKLFNDYYLHLIGYILLFVATGLFVIGFFQTNKLREKLKEDYN